MHEIRISPKILTSEEFRRLVMIAGEDPPVVLGRITALALAMRSSGRFRFVSLELDQITAWKKPGDHFGALLEAVGFATRKQGSLVYCVDLPIGGTRPQSRGGEARAAAAARSPAGAFIPQGSEQLQKSKKEKLTLDAEGNVLKGKT